MQRLIKFKMENDQYSEINVYCRFRPTSDDSKPIKIDYNDEGHITIEDDKDVRFP